MKSKAPLALIELAVMLAVFALAAVLCLRAFMWADTQSEQLAARDRAMTEVQNAAEELKACRGDFKAAAELYGGRWDGTNWTICYDGDWTQLSSTDRYVLTAEPADEDIAYLGAAHLYVLSDETCLARLEIAWQEVTPHE